MFTRKVFTFETGVMNDPLSLQEDNFEDDPDDDNELLDDIHSVCNEDFSFHEGNAYEEERYAQGYDQEAIRSRSKLTVDAGSKSDLSLSIGALPLNRLETITEESRVTSDGNDEPERSRVSENRRIEKAEMMRADNKISEDSEFFKPGAEFWVLEEEKFKKESVLTKDDWRFNRTHHEKERSWEPSITDSTPPIPSLEPNRLLKLCDKGGVEQYDKEVISKRGILNGNDEQKQDNKMQISSNSIAEERSVVLPSKDMYGSPMTSTPFADHRSKRTNLHDLSRECASISAIAVLPERMPSARAQHSSTRTVENKRVAFLEPKTNMNSISPIIRQNTLLSSSAIDRALSESRVVSMNDSQLIAALNNARKRTEHLTFKVPDLTGSNSQGNAISSTRNIYKHRERVGMEPLRSNNQIENIHQSNGGNIWNGDAGVQERENIPTAVEVRGIECGEVSVFKSSTVQPTQNDQLPHPTITSHSAPQHCYTQNATKSTAPYASSSSFTTPITSCLERVDGRHYLGCDRASVWFGCSEVDRSIIHTVRITNVSNTTLFLDISLRCKNNAFKLQQSGSVMLKRREDYCLHVTFKPNTAAFFKSAICIVVRNVERISYSIPVRGAGGTAILILRDQGHDISRMKDGSFVLTTSHPISVPIEIKNVGVRDAFAVISVLDSTTKKRIDRVNILPSDKAVILRRQKMKFEIKIDEKELEEARNRVDTTAATFGSTSALCGRSNYVIRVIWAEELLRYRLKRAEEELGREWKVDEISFTRGVFANEEKAKLATAACSAPYNVADRDTFECHLRVMTISVADNRRFIVRQQPQRQTQHDDAQVVVLEPDATLTAPDATTAIIQDVTLVPHK